MYEFGVRLNFGVGTVEGQRLCWTMGDEHAKCLLLRFSVGLGLVPVLLAPSVLHLSCFDGYLRVC
jgi:hypothetical protein